MLVFFLLPSCGCAGFIDALSFRSSLLLGIIGLFERIQIGHFLSFFLSFFLFFFLDGRLLISSASRVGRGGRRAALTAASPSIPDGRMGRSYRVVGGRLGGGGGGNDWFRHESLIMIGWVSRLLVTPVASLPPSPHLAASRSGNLCKWVSDETGVRATWTLCK